MQMVGLSQTTPLFKKAPMGINQQTGLQKETLDQVQFGENKWSKEKIEQEVIKVLLEKLGLQKEEIELTSNLEGDLGADSLDTIDICMEFEKKFDINIPDEEFEKIQTVEEWINCIDKKLNPAV